MTVAAGRFDRLATGLPPHSHVERLSTRSGREPDSL